MEVNNYRFTGMTSFLFINLATKPPETFSTERQDLTGKGNNTFLDSVATVKAFHNTVDRGALYLLKMATDSGSIERFFKDAVAENKGSNTQRREEMVFNRATGELEVKRNENVTGADRKVHLKMVKFFNFVVQEVLEKGDE